MSVAARGYCTAAVVLQWWHQPGQLAADGLYSAVVHLTASYVCCTSV
jgi:hypothetical protein